ncbi:hypothetical protein [Candidatus Cardinium hertigii]|nr:hypothetical protein [Candidatus Cardinium hertigii]
MADNINPGKLGDIEQTNVFNLETELLTARSKYEKLETAIEEISNQIDPLKNLIEQFAHDKNLEIKDINIFDASSAKDLSSDGIVKCLLPSLLNTCNSAQYVSDKARSSLVKAQDVLTKLRKPSLYYFSSHMEDGQRLLTEVNQHIQQINKYRVHMQYVITFTRGLIEGIQKLDSTSDSETTASELLSPTDDNIYEYMDRITCRIKNTQKTITKIVESTTLDLGIDKFQNEDNVDKECNILSVITKNTNNKIMYFVNLISNYREATNAIQECVTKLNKQVEKCCNTGNFNRDKCKYYKELSKSFNSIVKDIKGIIDPYQEAYSYHLIFASLHAKKLHENWEEFINADEKSNLEFLQDSFNEEIQKAHEKTRKASEKDSDMNNKLIHAKLCYDVLEKINNIEDQLIKVNEDSETVTKQYNAFTMAQSSPGQYDDDTLLVHNFNEIIQQRHNMTHIIQSIMESISNTVYKLCINDDQALNDMLRCITTQEKLLNKAYSELEQSIKFILTRRKSLAHCKKLQEIIEISNKNISDKKIIDQLNKLKQMISSMKNNPDINVLKLLNFFIDLTMDINKFTEKSVMCANYAAEIDFKEITEINTC